MANKRFLFSMNPENIGRVLSQDPSAAQALMKGLSEGLKEKVPLTTSLGSINFGSDKQQNWANIFVVQAKGSKQGTEGCIRPTRAGDRITMAMVFPSQRETLQEQVEALQKKFQ